MSKLRVLDLFSGIGGFSLGLERAGMETVAFCEIDPYCRAVLKKHWPDIPCDTDITKREFAEGEADVICGGFPCQDISFAGNGAGLAGERSGLWRELLRAIRVVRPLYAIVENVAALLSRGMDTVLGDLAEVGYDAEWHCIPASAVGAPHRRDRVWIVANARGEQHEGGCTPISGTLAKELFAADAIIHDGGPRGARRFDPSGARECQSFGPLQELADTASERCGEAWRDCKRYSERTSSGGEILADSTSLRRVEVVEPISERSESKGPASEIANGGFTTGRSWWAVEPNVGRVAHGVPARVDRLGALGNAVVPQIPELIGRAILEARAA